MDVHLLQRIAACPNLPSVPAVALEVVRLCQADEVELRSLVCTLEKDPAITAKILRTANSASIAARSPVTTITRALTLLGTNSVLTLALSFSLVATRRRGRHGGFDHDRYWRRALTAAAAARTLVEGRELDGEELFLCALLQDLGMLVLAEVMEDYGALVAASADDHAALAELERAALGASHAEVSAFLLSRWNLPGLVLETSRGSHDPPAGPSEPPALAHAMGCVHVAGLMAEVLAGRDPGPAAAAAERLLGMSAPALHAALERTAAALPEVTGIFEVPLSSPAEVERVLARARQALVLVSARVERASTRVLARPELERALDLAVAAAVDQGEPLTVARCRVERTRSLDDGLPAAACDRVLTAVAAALGAAVRASDLVGHYGGDELVLVMPETDEPQACLVSEHLLRAVERARPPGPDGAPLMVSLAIGQATLHPGDPFATAQALLDAAGSRLQRTPPGPQAFSEPTALQEAKP